MAISYLMELREGRDDKRRASRPWIECFLSQTPPTYEDCVEHFKEMGMLVTKADYEDVCKKHCLEPQFRK
jgi:hypothetical protein